MGYTVDTNWYADSGMTDHIISDLDRLMVRNRYKGGDQVHVASGTSLHISRIGQSAITRYSRPIQLKNILYVPNICKHLLSVNRLVSDNHAFLEFHPHFFLIKDQTTKEILLEGRSNGDLYPLNSARRLCASSRLSLATTKIPIERWHRRLGHPSIPVIPECA